MKPITNAKIAYEIIAPLIKNEEHEHLVCVTLKKDLSIHSIHIVAIGDEKSVELSNKNILQLALLDQASGIIIAHNHPSGNLTPSIADIRLTERLRQALTPMDIPLMDHLIITPKSYYSFAQEN